MNALLRTSVYGLWMGSSFIVHHRVRSCAVCSFLDSVYILVYFEVSCWHHKVHKGAGYTKVMLLCEILSGNSPETYTVSSRVINLYIILLYTRYIRAYSC